MPFAYISLFKHGLLSLFGCTVISSVAIAAAEIKPAPTAELRYTIKAKQKGIPVSGEAFVKWQLGSPNDAQSYSVVTETRVALFGKILDASSFGHIDSLGLVPDKFVEKRFGKAESTTRFDHSSKTINFTESTQTYKLKGGEQDRTSATWQLVTLARAAADKFVTGSEWKMFVAGRRDAEDWSFKVAGTELVVTPLGEFSAVHFIKAPPPDSKDQQLEIWLAPKLEWYPIRLKFSDADGDHVDQLLGSIRK
jgi:hypothetical protein